MKVIDQCIFSLFGYCLGILTAIVVIMFLASCTSTSNVEELNSCIGTSGNTLSCSNSTCSHSEGSNCSSFIDGVCCCNNENEMPSD